MKKRQYSNQDSVQILDHQDERWLDYINSNPQATPFHHPGWLSALSECYGYHPFIVVTQNDDGKITAGLPVMEVRSMVTGKRWVSLPFTDYCAPLSDDPESLSQLTDGLLALYEDVGTPRVEVRWDLPPHAAIHSHTAFYLHVVPLDTDPQCVLKGFKRTHRQNIGTAEDRGVHIERGTGPEHLRRFYAMQLETRRRFGIPVQPWKFFELLGEQLLAPGLGFILLAYKDEQCLAGGLFLHWQHTLTYKYAASSNEGQEYRPNNLLSWTAMRWGCENGFTDFDLGRTDQDNAGLRRFKRGWGAQESPLPYSVIAATSPDGLQNGDGKLMSLLSSVIQKSPPWVCKMTGELLYRHFG